MAPSITDSESVSLEKTRGILNDLFEFPDTLWGLMKKREVQKVGQRGMRLPFKVIPAGKFGQSNFDGGDLGLGSAAKFKHGIVNSKDFAVAVQSTKAMEYTTDSKEKAVFMVTKDDVDDAMSIIKCQIDALLQTPGTGQIGVMSSGATTTSWVLGGNFGAKLMLEGQSVSSYDSTFATKRVGDSEIQTVEIETNTVTVDAAPAAHADTDLIVITGLSGANPVSLYGIPYHHSNATSGTWLGLDRALIPGIRTPAVNAGGANLTPAHVRLALNKSRMRLGIDTNAGEFIAWMNMAQEASYEDIAQSQIQIIKEADSNQGYDPFFAVKTIAGVKIKSGIHADPTRIDFLRLSDWGRAETKPIDYIKWGDLTKLPLPGASGGWKAADIFYMGVGMQIWNQNPRAGTYVYALGVPDGYGYP